jgi:hypothetical protein
MNASPTHSLPREVEVALYNKAAEINDNGGQAYVYHNRLIIGLNALGTWTLLLPTIMSDMPFVAAADYVTETQAQMAADAYIARV